MNLIKIIKDYLNSKPDDYINQEVPDNDQYTARKMEIELNRKTKKITLFKIKF